jgi:hypothetical protein
MKHLTDVKTLEEQREAFSSRRFLAMPLSGLICWAIIGIGSLFLNNFHSVLLVFIATGSIVYIAMIISKLTGETFFRKEKNTFDRLFLGGLLMSLLVYSIAIPFFLQDYRSVTLTVGILTGLMWIPFSWIIQHWIGYFHTISRTILILIAWYVFPEHHFQVIPAIIVLIYIITIYTMEKRWNFTKATTPPLRGTPPMEGNLDSGN